MTVKELVVKLQALPDDYTVYLSKDEEGNGYGELRDVGESYYTGEGVYYEPEMIHPDDLAEIQGEERKVDKVIVLWP